jgi:hypothetical protein
MESSQNDAAAEAVKEAVKDSRRVLRQVQIHLLQSRINMGAICESAGLADVLHHPFNSLPHLNYVTPRKSTAWISVKEIEQGLEALAKYNRPRRVEYIEGLFLPIFAKSLREIGLVVQQETPLMVYQPGENHANAATPVPVMPPLPDGVVIDEVKDHEGSSVWWYIWRNAHYDVITQTAEPIYVGQSIMQIALGWQIDILMHRYRFPVGAARITVLPENQTAHIAALALMREVRTPDMLKLLQRHAIQAAVQRGCTLVFTSGETEQDRRLSRENGFIDYGSLVCYAETQSKPGAHKDFLHDRVAQPVLTLR